VLLGLSYNHFPERQTYLKYFLTKLWKVGIHSWNKKIKIKIKELWKESLNSDGQQFIYINEVEPPKEEGCYGA
jgi:hypothetical protein